MRDLDYKELFKDGVTDEAMALWKQYTLDRCRVKVEQYLWKVKWFKYAREDGIAFVNSFEEAKPKMIDASDFNKEYPIIFGTGGVIPGSNISELFYIPKDKYGKDVDDDIFERKKKNHKCWGEGSPSGSNH